MATDTVQITAVHLIDPGKIVVSFSNGVKAEFTAKELITQDSIRFDLRNANFESTCPVCGEGIESDRGAGTVDGPVHPECFNKYLSIPKFVSNPLFNRKRS